MLGKRFSFKVQKDHFYLNFQFKMTKRKTFYKLIATTTKKSRGLLTKINKHCLFWLNFMGF